MALEIQKAVTELVVGVLEAGKGETPGWLMRPGRAECGSSWSLVCELYGALTGGESLPDTMPPRERRSVDYVLVVDGQHRILEVDETQHFNRFRAETLRRYPATLDVAFPVADWIAQSERKQKLESGGFGRPKPPLFPEQGGRHQQRAFRDALADILPAEHGCLPTLRIADFEVVGWLESADAASRMASLLAARGLRVG